MTNAAIALAVVVLETNWVPRAIITPINTGQSNFNSTVRHIEELEVTRYKWFAESVDGKEVRTEVNPERYPFTNSFGQRLLRVVPTNYPPTAIYGLQLETLIHRQDATPIPVPPLPPKR